MLLTVVCFRVLSVIHSKDSEKHMLLEVVWDALLYAIH